MPSIFSRARTASTPGKSSKPVLSLSAKSSLTTTDSRSRTPLSPGGYDEFGGRLAAEGGFLPTAVPVDLRVAWAGTGGPVRAAYGFLSPGRDAVLGLGDVARLVGTVCAGLETKGLATPFVFSSLGLDVRRAGVVRLVEAFLGTCEGGGGDVRRWTEEARFAGAHELGMCLRWGLSRVVRVEGGREVRGLLSWADYERWRQEEAATGHPPTAYSALLANLPAQLRPVIAPVLALCTRLVAHSATTGLTPPTLAAVLSPLLFGLCSTPEFDDALFPTIDDFSSFPALYAAFLRGARAAEHILLASIRETVHDAEARGLGAPTRLREWVGMYPASLDLAAQGANPRRGAKTVRVVHVRRNVRSYSVDLVTGGSSWAGASGANQNSPNEWATSKAWRAILAGGAGVPRFADSFRKRLDLAPGVQPAAPGASFTPSPYAPSAYSASSTSLTDDAAAFKSLTDFKWGEFETLGFSSAPPSSPASATGGIDGRLQFDLTENARAERMAKRETLSWSDFSSAGFSRGDKPLSATLQFSAPLTLLSAASTSSTSSSSSSSGSPGGLNPEMTRRLKKAHKALPAFGWDTSPVLGGEEVLEEAFLDVFCDLLCGGGWAERAAREGGVRAELARECAWALVEYKSRSSSSAAAVAGAQDTTTLVLYEEFVPREYRLALAGVSPSSSSSARRRLPALFTPSPGGGGKTWKQAATLNGKPYVLGAVPAPSASVRERDRDKEKEADFEGMLRAQGGTRVITLGGGGKQVRSPTTITTSPTSATAESPALAVARTRSTDDSSADSTGTGLGLGINKRQSGRFRLPGGIGAGPSPGVSRPVPAEAQAVEFETRLAGLGSDDDDDVDDDGDPRRGRGKADADADAWVDILVGSVQARRMGGQDAELGRGSARRRGVVAGADAGLANMQRAQALAAETMGRVASPEFDEIERRREQRAREREQERLRDSDVVEVERVPRAHQDDDDDEEEEEESLASEESGNVTPTHPVIQQARDQRRMGYFDLHPERRPPSVATTNDNDDDDPRSLLSRTDSEEDAEIDVQPRNLDIRPLPTPTAPVPPREYPANGNGHSDIPIAAPKPTPAGTPTKTSALIDMFRERELLQQQQRVKPAGPVPAPSRLPVRTLPIPAAPAANATTPPAPPAPALAPSPPAKTTPPPPLDPTAIEPPRVPLGGDPGRASPARYVHGAPLHNVMEEEEEET